MILDIFSFVKILEHDTMIDTYMIHVMIFQQVCDGMRDPDLTDSLTDIKMTTSMPIQYNCPELVSLLPHNSAKLLSYDS